MKRRYSNNYVRNDNPLKLRFIAIWRIITKRNFILIDFEEYFVSDRLQGVKAARKVRPLYRTDYDAQSEYLTLLAATDMTEKKIKK